MLAAIPVLAGVSLVNIALLLLVVLIVLAIIGRL